MITQACGRCGGYEIDIDPGNLTAEGVAILMAAQDSHYDTCRPAAPAVTHIRRQIARKRGNGFYKPQYGPSEDGSQTLCGADPTGGDMGYGDARYAKYLALVTCDTCKGLR